MNSKELTNVVLKYCKNESPGYAIMIDGPWGIGKTHFIKELLDENKKLKAIHVSLYGAASTSQIDDSIFAALVGCADVSDSEIKKAGDFLGKMFSAFGDKTEGSAVGAIASISGEALKKRTLKSLTSNTVLIFDDFERSKVSQSETLSKINEFVEHQKLKAIILCDERAVIDKEYHQAKEKVILHTNGFERTPEEIASICFEAKGCSKADEITVYKSEFIRIVEQFNLTNIRTLKHGLECFLDISSAIQEIDLKYQSSPVLSDILFSTIVLSAGYRDYSVPVGELKKTIQNYSEMAVAYHMKEREEAADETNWERFYTNILAKCSRSLEFHSVFELVCRGHLNKSLIAKDLESWEGRATRPDSPITNFRIDEPIDNEEFNSHIETALDILNSPTYEFYSTAELYSFCNSLYFIYFHKGFSFDGDFGKKLKKFAKLAVRNCKNHTEPSSFGCRDDNHEVLKSIFSTLTKSSKKLAEAQLIENTRTKLLNDLKKGGIKRIVDSGDSGFSKSIINRDFIYSLKHMLAELDNTSVRAFGIFIENRFIRDSDYETYKDEIRPLAELSQHLQKYLKDSGKNLSTMMISLLSKTVSDVVSKAKEMGILD